DRAAGSAGQDTAGSPGRQTNGRFRCEGSAIEHHDRTLCDSGLRRTQSRQVIIYMTRVPTGSWTWRPEVAMRTDSATNDGFFNVFNESALIAILSMPMFRL